MRTPNPTPAADPPRRRLVAAVLLALLATPAGAIAAAAAPGSNATTTPVQPATGDGPGAGGGAAAPAPPAAVTVSLEAERTFNGTGRSFDVVLRVDRIPVAGDDAEPGSVAELQRRMLPRERRRAEAEARTRRAEAEAAATAPLPDVRLVLLRHDGTPIEETPVLAPGPVDLAVVMPAIWSLRETAWLQPVVAGEPAGTPLVLVPMLSRRVPVPAETVSPSGVRTTRIAGWVDERDAWDAMLATLRGRPWPPPSADPADPDGSEVAAGAEGAGGDESEDPDGTAAGASGSGEPGADAARGAAAARTRVFTGLRVHRDALVELDTEFGAILLELRPDAAPNTVRNFRTLVDGGFYRRTVFHRVVPMTPAGDPFVIQGGDPSGDGAGGPGWWLPMEDSPLPHDFGVVSMARDIHPDSAGSQFFICLSRAGTARLDGSYTAFGRVVEGGDVVRRIAQVPLADVATGRPRRPPMIRDARLVPAPPRTIREEPMDATPEASPSRPVRVPR